MGGGGGVSFHRVLKEKKGSFHFAARVFIELRNRVDRRKNPKRKPVRDWRKGKKTAMQQEEKDEKKTNKQNTPRGGGGGGGTRKRRRQVFAARTKKKY